MFIRRYALLLTVNTLIRSTWRIYVFFSIINEPGFTQLHRQHGRLVFILSFPRLTLHSVR